MMPDFYTLFLVILMLGLSHCIIWGLVVYRYPEIAGAWYWFSGGLAGVVGGLTLALQGTDANIFATVGGNACVTLSFYMTLAGVRRFHGETSGWQISVILLGLSVLVMLATFYPWYARNPSYTMIQLLPIIMTASFLRSKGSGDLGATLSIVALLVAALAHLVIAVGNVLLLTGVTPELDLKYAAAIDLLVFVFAGVVWNLGFVLSVVDRLRSEVERLAHEDELTGLANRRMLMNRLTMLCKASKHKQSYGLMLFDLDNFKAINDRYGHAAGDAALKHAATVISEKLEPRDLFARLGGDEFCVVLPGASEQEAAVKARRIVAGLRAARLKWENIEVPVKTSIGIVCWNSRQAVTPEGLLDLADRALYDTKRLGRDGYSLYGQIHPQDHASNVIQLSLAAGREDKS